MLSIDKIWYDKKNFVAFLCKILLLPLSFILIFISFVRRIVYKLNILKSVKVKVPLIIVGGISVGGSGKTPLSIALIKLLSDKGYKVGLISRGYKAKAPYYPYIVEEKGDFKLCGDEPLLIKRSVGNKATVIIDPVRTRGAQKLCKLGCDIIISDDGLQHYALKRDLEIIVLDGERLLGNGQCLPAGPLREGRWRLEDADFVIVNGNSNKYFKDNFTLEAKKPVNIKNNTCLNEKQVNVLAGIGNPSRFYKTCESLGFSIVEKVDVLDHGIVSLETLKKYSKERPLVMTSKDAVKYLAYGLDNLYEIKVETKISEDFAQRIISKIEKSKK